MKSLKILAFLLIFAIIFDNINCESNGGSIIAHGAHHRLHIIKKKIREEKENAMKIQKETIKTLTVDPKKFAIKNKSN